MTPTQAVHLLRQGGVAVGAGDVRVHRRGQCFAAWLPDDRLAWFPTDAESANALAVENRVLGLLAERCRFRVPAVLDTSPDGWTVRSLVAGTVDPEGLAARMKSDPAVVLGIAASLAGMLAEQHGAIGEADVVGWLPTVPGSPMPRDSVDGKLPLVVSDEGLRRRIGRALDAYDGLVSGKQDRVLAHTDLALQNLPVDWTGGTVNGIFDYRGAAWADRHLDFRYLVFGAVPDALLDATMQAYADATGVALSRRRILLSNAAVAISHLAARAGHGPDEAIEGRTLARDLAWTDWSLRRCGFVV